MNCLMINVMCVPSPCPPAHLSMKNRSCSWDTSHHQCERTHLLQPWVIFVQGCGKISANICVFVLFATYPISMLLPVIKAFSFPLPEVLRQDSFELIIGPIKKIRSTFLSQLEGRFICRGQFFFSFLAIFVFAC